MYCIEQTIRAGLTNPTEEPSNLIGPYGPVMFFDEMVELLVPDTSEYSILKGIDVLTLQSTDSYAKGWYLLHSDNHSQLVTKDFESTRSFFFSVRTTATTKIAIEWRRLSLTSPPISPRPSITYADPPSPSWMGSMGSRALGDSVALGASAASAALTAPTGLQVHDTSVPEFHIDDLSVGLGNTLIVGADHAGNFSLTKCLINRWLQDSTGHKQNTCFIASEYLAYSQMLKGSAYHRRFDFQTFISYLEKTSGTAGLVILDNCDKTCSEGDLSNVLSLGYEHGKTFVILSEGPIVYSRTCRSFVDAVFISGTDDEQLVKKLWHNFGSSVPSLDAFADMIDDHTWNVGSFLLIDPASDLFSCQLPSTYTESEMY